MRHKNRIMLPKSASLFGVIDPFGILAENEIFVQIKRNTHIDTNLNIGNISPSHIIKGKVLATKSPCTHPGDTRLA